MITAILLTAAYRYVQRIRNERRELDREYAKMADIRSTLRRARRGN